MPVSGAGAFRGGVEEILIVANPCFGLDFLATGGHCAYRLSPRSRGTAVLLVSEDLDEILELADRTVVMATALANWSMKRRRPAPSLALIGRHMTGHAA